jgi:hypothetical protein
VRLALRTSPPADPSSRHLAIDRLRSVIVLLVIAHHAVLAYHPYAPARGDFTATNLTWAAFPVVDTARTHGFDLFTLWNESFFMALVFLISGLFVAPSLRRKGPACFLRDRLLRLGVPFVIGTLLLAPLAYYPAYLQLAAENAPRTFWRHWLALGAWPPGPLWFLPVLLAFDALAVLVLRFFPFWNEKPAALGSLTKTRPLPAYLTLLILAIAAYAPMSFVADPFGWWVWGPFVVQGSRWALYAVYFFFGVALSVGKVGGDLFTLTAKLGHRWKAWFAAAVFMFAAFALVLVAAFYADQQNSEHAFLVGVAARIAYAATGVTTSFAMLAFFTRSDAPHRPLFAHLIPNAFAMYIIHHGIVSWLQYALLGTPLSATTKGIAVVFAAIVLSWTTAAALRKIPALERVLQ